MTNKKRFYSERDKELIQVLVANKVSKENIAKLLNRTNKNYNPLCYGCNKNEKEYNILSSNVNDCCEDQFDKKKYPNLKSPDYAFKDDTINRINYYNQKNYKLKKLI